MRRSAATSRARERHGTVEGIARAARVANVLLGTWLLVSAVLLAHGPALRASDALCGALVATAALAGLLVAPRLHVVEVPLSLWVLISVWVLPGVPVTTLVNDLFVATLMFGFSVVPDGVTPPEGDRHAFPA